VLINVAANIDPTKNMKGCEDFMLTVLHAHVVSAAKVILKTTQFENASDLAKEIVVRYTSFHPDIKETVQDKVHLYAQQVLNLLLLWHAFNIAIKEGDGERVLTY